MWPSGGWGSIEYGSAQPGQVTGGRWKPLHYIFKASTFADQMSTCNTAGACFVRNDSPFAFSGQATVRLLNVVTGKSVAMNQHALALAPGAGVTEWYCADKAAGKTERAAEALAGATYTRHSLQIPLDRNNYTRQVAADEAGCEAACNAEPKCLGFTLMSGAICWLYDVVPSLHNDPEADWWQKPGTRPIPAPPPPPPPPGPPAPPASPQCTGWNASAAWTEAGCKASATVAGSAMAANCVVVIDVLNATKSRVSHNVLPFLAPN